MQSFVHIMQSFVHIMQSFVHIMHSFVFRQGVFKDVDSKDLILWNVIHVVHFLLYLFTYPWIYGKKERKKLFFYTCFVFLYILCLGQTYNI